MSNLSGADRLPKIRKSFLDKMLRCPRWKEEACAKDKYRISTAGPASLRAIGRTACIPGSDTDSVCGVFGLRKMKRTGSRREGGPLVLFFIYRRCASTFTPVLCLGMVRPMRSKKGRTLSSLFSTARPISMCTLRKTKTAAAIQAASSATQMAEKP